MDNLCSNDRSVTSLPEQQHQA